MPQTLALVGKAAHLEDGVAQVLQAVDDAAQVCRVDDLPVEDAPASAHGHGGLTQLRERPLRDVGQAFGKDELVAHGGPHHSLDGRYLHPRDGRGRLPHPRRVSDGTTITPRLGRTRYAPCGPWVPSRGRGPADVGGVPTVLEVSMRRIGRARTHRARPATTVMWSCPPPPAEEPDAAAAALGKSPAGQGLPGGRP